MTLSQTPLKKIMLKNPVSKCIICREVIDIFILKLLKVLLGLALVLAATLTVHIGERRDLEPDEALFSIETVHFEIPDEISPPMPSYSAEPPDNTAEPEPSEPEVPVEPEPPEFFPFAVEETLPEKMIASAAVMAGGVIVDEFNFPERIDFGFGHTYTDLEGITTFRGNHLRDTASFGRADIRNGRFGNTWTRNTASLMAPDGVVWTGHGWTGQPLIVRWPAATREIMTNMHTWAKAQDDLVEVIYPAMDGFIYFAELETGRVTRDRLFIGFTFKGGGSIDPRGYPLLYVGAGYESARGASRIFIISLINGSVLHTFGNNDSFAPRTWNPADASPLIDAGTDNLIVPSENGVLYIIKLNSEFDPEAGTMTIEPDQPVKWRFRGIRSHSNGRFWLGFESSPAIWRGHIFLADNGGHLICLDLNTLEIVWVVDNIDDTNCTPVLAIEDDHPYIYISMAFHGAGWRAPASSSAVVPIRKIDALTGEIVWHTDYYCYTVRDLSGGVQGTLALGRYELSHLIFVPVARTPTIGGGTLAALDRHTGEVVWEYQTGSYSWSSPVCVYDRNGKGYVIYNTMNGTMHLLDGMTGERLDSIALGGTVESSPAVFENTIVIGTRGSIIWGVELT